MKKNSTFPNVKDFIDFVGRRKFQDSLGHTPQVVSRAIKNSEMPAHWYIGVRRLCNDLGVFTPEHLFKWTHPEPINKQPANKDVNADHEFQDGGM